MKILDYLKDNGIQDKVVHTRKKLGGDIPVKLSEVLAGYVEMPSDEEVDKAAEIHADKYDDKTHSSIAFTGFRRGIKWLKQSKTKGNN